MKQQIATIANTICIQPMTIPAVAIPSPEALGGVARVSCRAEYPVHIAAMLAIIGKPTKPSIPAIRLIVANVLVGNIV